MRAIFAYLLQHCFSTKGNFWPVDQTNVAFVENKIDTLSHCQVYILCTAWWNLLLPASFVPNSNSQALKHLLHAAERNLWLILTS